MLGFGFRTPLSNRKPVTARGPTLLAVPNGFLWTPPFNLSRSADGVYATDFDIDTLKPISGKTYYWNPVNGSDAANGLTPSTARLSLSQILALPDVDRIEVTGLTGDVIVRSTRAWNAVNVQRSVYLYNQTGYRVILAAVSATLPAWTLNPTHGAQGVYESTTSATAGMIDAGVRRAPLDPITGSPLVHVPSSFDAAVRVNSIAAVASANGSAFFHDGSKLYYKTANGRAPDTNVIRVITGTVGGRASSANNVTVFCENIDFVGGESGFNFVTNSAPSIGTFAAVGCTFQGSASSNGLSVRGRVSVYLKECAAYFNALDGFNYHNFVIGGANSPDSPRVFEERCVAWGNGTTGSAGTSDNASSIHGGGKIIRLNSCYVDSDDNVVVDIDFTHNWMLGCRVGKPRKAGSVNISAQGQAQTWLDGVEVEQHAGSEFLVTSTATLRFRNMLNTPSGGAGTYLPY